MQFSFSFTKYLSGIPLSIWYASELFKSHELAAAYTVTFFSAVSAMLCGFGFLEVGIP